MTTETTTRPYYTLRIADYIGPFATGTESYYDSNLVKQYYEYEYFPYDATAENEIDFGKHEVADFHEALLAIRSICEKFAAQSDKIVQFSAVDNEAQSFITTGWLRPVMGLEAIAPMFPN